MIRDGKNRNRGRDKEEARGEILTDLGKLYRPYICTNTGHNYLKM